MSYIKYMMMVGNLFIWFLYANVEDLFLTRRFRYVLKKKHFV